MPTASNGVVYAMYGDLAYVQSFYLLSGSQKPTTESEKSCFTEN